MMGNRIHWLLTACALIVLTVVARADDPAPSEYVLGPDDVIEIVVKNHSDLNKIATITLDGTIVLTDVGEVKAAGMTARKLAANIQTELEKTRNNVAVSVIVKEIHPPKLRVRVLGASKTVGIIEIKPKDRLIDLIASTGGLVGKPALVLGRIVRGVDVLFLDVPEAFAHPEGPANVVLQPGDLVLFDEKEILHPQITVVGQVEKPGTYDLEATTSLSSLMTQTGGSTSKAALNKAYILRKGQRIPVNMIGAAAGQNPTVGGAEVQLQPNDIIFIPENTDRYAIMGEARQTGTFAYPATGKVTVLQAYTQVGGVTSQGDLKNAGIIRFVNGQYTAVPVNIAMLLDKKSSAVNPPMEPGDTLYIPQRKNRGGLNWSALLTPLSALSLLGLRLGR